MSYVEFFVVCCVVLSVLCIPFLPPPHHLAVEQLVGVHAQQLEGALAVAVGTK
jgi:hypothetical protein